MHSSTVSLSTVSFRAAQATDLPELLRLKNACLPGGQMGENYMARCLRLSLRTPRSEFMQVACKDAPVGFCAGTMIKPDEGIIRMLGVDEPHRGLRLGSTLLTRVCQSLTEVGADKIILHVDKENEIAQQLYKTHGFEFDGQCILDQYEMSLNCNI